MRFAASAVRALGQFRRWATMLGTASAVVATVTTLAIGAETTADPAAGHHAPGGAAGAALSPPYAAQPGAKDTGLLREEVEGLTKGTGMALALPAEMNGYPGPRHILDAAAAGHLPLTADQREAVQHLADRMSAEARAKGQEILQAEANLALRFRHAHIEEATLRDLVDRIGRLRAELRFIHLRTHLETKALLTTEQLGRYNTLRGYDAGGSSHQPGH